MKASIVIPTYKDIIALKLILDALQYQTYKDFEIIIAEDDDSIEIKNLLSNYKSKYTIKHYFHEDNGNRKPKAVNNAIKISTGEYIIFIDGDTIPYSTFIENHIKLSGKNICLCGRRVNLGDKVSQGLRKSEINALYIEQNYLKLYLYLSNDNIRHYEQGFVFKPNKFIEKFINKLNKNETILASNFSCYKNKLIEVNGIDESLPYAPSRDDYDLQWRLEYIGVRMRSCKYCANLLHLNHSRDDRNKEDAFNKMLIEKKKLRNEYRVKNGILKE